MFRSFDGGATWRTGTLPTRPRLDWGHPPRDVYAGGFGHVRVGAGWRDDLDYVARFGPAEAGLRLDPHRRPHRSGPTLCRTVHRRLDEPRPGSHVDEAGGRTGLSRTALQNPTTPSRPSQLRWASGCGGSTGRDSNASRGLTRRDQQLTVLVSDTRTVNPPGPRHGPRHAASAGGSHSSSGLPSGSSIRANRPVSGVSHSGLVVTAMPAARSDSSNASRS